MSSDRRNYGPKSLMPCQVRCTRIHTIRPSASTTWKAQVQKHFASDSCQPVYTPAPWQVFKEHTVLFNYYLFGETIYKDPSGGFPWSVGSQKVTLLCGKSVYNSWVQCSDTKTCISRSQRAWDWSKPSTAQLQFFVLQNCAIQHGSHQPATCDY